MKTPIGIPRIAPIRNPQATDPASQPIRIPITITAAVVPIRTEPAPARLRFGVGVGSIGGASIAELVTAEMRLVSRKSGDFVRWDDGTSGPRPRLGSRTARDVRAQAWAKPATTLRALLRPGSWALLAASHGEARTADGDRAAGGG